MSDLAVPTRACWTAESAHAMFRVEALEGNEAVFLATHSPIHDFAVTGSRADQIDAPTEEALLAAISHPAVHHAFCVVEGEPGSGKSHLIRWLYVNWPRDGRDTPLLLQRSDGSLEGALQQLKETLPPEFKELFDGLGTKQKVGETGRIRTFHSNLRQSLRPDHYETPLKDNEWCARWHPADLLRLDVVEEQWAAPGRILGLVSGKEGERNSESARFNIFDVYDLQELVTPTDLKSPQARNLYANLLAESVSVDEARDSGLEIDQIVREYGTDIPHHIAFAEALNRRRNDAIQLVIGVSSASLKKLFREVRRVLRLKDRRLVLLLEDITSWEGLDDSLIDVLTTNADTRSETDDGRDQCDLVSVVGLTPDYYHTELRTNYQDRITHQVSLGHGDDGLQDVAMMREANDRLQFVRRYLAATRAGPKELIEWRDRLREDPSLSPPNKCDSCALASGCHGAFGSVDGVGLYPFTARALDGFFDALKEQGERRTWKTPRGLIQAILSPTLRQPQIFDDAAYPGPNIEVAAFDPRTRFAPADLDRILHARVDDEPIRDRLRRTFTFWGAGGDLQTTLEREGQLAFHAVPRSVFEAFQLPWLGGEQGEAIVVPAEVVPVEEVPAAQAAPAALPPAPAESASDIGAAPATYAAPSAEALSPTATPSPVRPTASTRPPSATPTSGSRPTRRKLDPSDISQWRNEGGKLKNPNEWNDVLYAVATTLDPRQMGYDGWAWKNFIQPTTLKIEGTATARRDLLIVPAEPWLLDGLEAYAAIEAGGPAVADRIEHREARLARMRRHLNRRIQSYIDRNLGVTEADTPWRPAVAAAQTLLARAWLRGIISPTDPPAEQWLALLRDESTAESAPLARTAKWQSLLNATAPHHANLRTLLRESLSLPQGTSKEFGLASGVATAAILRLIGELEFSDRPAKVIAQTEARKIVEYCADLVIKASDLLPAIISEERRRLSERSGRLLKQMRGQSLRAHGARLDAALDAASKALPGVASEKIREWKQAYGAIGPVLADDVSSLQATLLQFGPEADNLEADDPATLAALIEAQAAVLESIGGAFTAGEGAVVLMADHANATIDQSGPIAGLERVHNQGEALSSGATKIIELLDARTSA